MFKYVIAILCSIVFMLSLIGNLLVISVIIRYKRLKNATNYILLSLAIADLTVTFCVMLPATIQDILGEWIWSAFFCKCYIALDITCCTASILHLLLVSIDRYIAIFNPMTYQIMIKKWHIFALVIMVWTLSFCMSFIPIFMGWNELSDTPSIIEDFSHNATNLTNFMLSEQSSLLATSTISDDSMTIFSNNSMPVVDEKVCYMESNIPYAIISSSLSFYIPLVIMTVVYSQIYSIAKRQAKQIAQLDFHSQEVPHDQAEQYLKQYQTNNKKDQKTGILIDELLQNDEGSKMDKKMRFVGLVKSIKKIEKKRTKDKKAIKTLGIIMGIFTFCWLPFFLMYLLVPLTNWYVPIFWERVITWIGYVNSFINPIVYALTNRDFRKAYIATLKSVFENLDCYRSSSQDDLNMRNSFGSNERKRQPGCLKKLLCCSKSNEKAIVPNNNNHNSNNNAPNNQPDNLKASFTNLKLVQQSDNNIEKEIVKLIDKEPDSIQYIDEVSDNRSYVKAELTNPNDMSKNPNLEHKLMHNPKYHKKKSYLDFTDDEISLDNKKPRNRKVPNSFSSDVIHKPSAKNKGMKKFLSLKHKSNTTSNTTENMKNLQENYELNTSVDKNLKHFLVSRNIENRLSSSLVSRNTLFGDEPFTERSPMKTRLKKYLHRKISTKNKSGVNLNLDNNNKIISSNSHEREFYAGQTIDVVQIAKTKDKRESVLIYRI